MAATESPSPATPGRDTRRYETIVADLERAMNSGQIQPGDRLPSERELMARHGAGRASVREALFTLQRMGLVKLARGERACAVRPSASEMLQDLAGAARRMLAQPDGVRHFQHARRLFECALAQEAAENADPASLAALAEALRANERARGTARAIATDVEFHAQIAAMSRNPVLTALQTAVGGWLREQRVTSVQAPRARTDANAAHRRIYAAIAAHDGPAAAAAMRAHLEEVERYYWAVANPAPPAA